MMKFIKNIVFLTILLFSSNVYSYNVQEDENSLILSDVIVFSEDSDISSASEDLFKKARNVTFSYVMLYTGQNDINRYSGMNIESVLLSFSQKKISSMQNGYEAIFEIILDKNKLDDIILQFKIQDNLYSEKNSLVNIYLTENSNNWSVFSSFLSYIDITHRIISISNIDSGIYISVMFNDITIEELKEKIKAYGFVIQVNNNNHFIRIA